MKVAIWGTLIIMLGMLGIVIIQVLQNVTVTNDQTYYLLKETTEAAMYDSIDLAYYRTTGQIRVVSDKFAENLARRFAASSDLNRNYTIKVNEVIENPPKVSLSIGTYALSLQGEKFDIGQTLDSIIESKNPSTGGTTPTPPPCEGASCTPTPPPYCEDPSDPSCNTCPICPAGDPNCESVSECMTGDLKWTGWDTPDVPSPDEFVCTNKSAPSVTTNAKYDSCDCGKWVSHTQAIKADPVKNPTYYEYTWNFSKAGPITSLNPNPLQAQVPIVNNAKCGNATCPDTTIYLGQAAKIDPAYVPDDAINRDVTWDIVDESIATVTNATLPPNSPSGVDSTYVTGKKIGSTQLTVTSTMDVKNKCDITVEDPWVCPKPDPTTLSLGEVKQGLIVNVPGVTFTISPGDQTVATIDNERTSGNKTLFDVIAGSKIGQITYTMHKNGYDDLPCQIKVTPNDNWVCPSPEPTSLYISDDKDLSIAVPGATISATANSSIATTSNVKTSGNTTTYKVTAGTTTGTTSYTIKKTGSGLPTLTCHIDVSRDVNNWKCPPTPTLHYGNTTQDEANLTMPFTGLTFKVIDTSAGVLSVTSTSSTDTKFKITANNKTMNGADYTISKAGYNPLTCHFDTTAWKCQDVSAQVGTQVLATKSLPSDVTAPSGIKWTTSNSSIATVTGSGTSSKFDPLKATNGVNFTVSAPNYNSLTCQLEIKNPPAPTGCDPGDISVTWDTSHSWSSGGPDLCPQDFEDVTDCTDTPMGPMCSTSKPATSKIGTINDKAEYCGYYSSSYTSNGRADWDKTIYPTNVYPYNISANLGSSSYTLTLTQTFNYDGWTTKVGPYTTGVTVVTRNKQITGTLLSRNDSKCKAITSNSSKFVTLSSEGGSDLIAGTNGVQIGASLYSSPTQYNTSSGKFTSSDSSILQITNDHDTYATMKPLKQGSVTVSYYINDSSGNPVHKLGASSGPAATYAIDVYPKCSDVYISGPSSFDKYDSKLYSVQPSFGGESAWSTSKSSVLEIKENTGVYRQSITGHGIKAGSATLTAIRRVDNCKKTMTVTVKQTYVCPTGYTEYNTDYCYDPHKIAPATRCSQFDGYSYGPTSGWCFQSYNSWYAWYYYSASVQKEAPSICDPWYTIKQSGACRYATPKVPS